jgi:hypothetical protein
MNAAKTPGIGILNIGCARVAVAHPGVTQGTAIGRRAAMFEPQPPGMKPRSDRQRRKTMTGFSALISTAWSAAQATAVVMFCIGTGLALPVALISFGIPIV